MKKISLYNFYLPEFRRIALTLLSISTLLAVICYHRFISDTVFSEKGMMVSMGLATGWVAASVIRIYYRVMVIRYGKKDRKAD
jgi:hypothetical protein